MTFEKWLDKVNEVFIKITGLDRDSWPDQDYWSMFDAGNTPMEAVIATIENEYGDAGLEAFGFQWRQLELVGCLWKPWLPPLKMNMATRA